MIAVEPSFGEDNVTLTVTLEEMQSMIHGLTYGVEFASSFEEIIEEFSGGSDASVELTMLYNTEYNLSTYSTLCGLKSRSHALNLFYGELSVHCNRLFLSLPGETIVCTSHYSSILAHCYNKNHIIIMVMPP